MKRHPVKFRICIAALSVAGIITIGIASPAGATSIDRVQDQVFTVADDLGAVGEAANAEDYDALYDVCETLGYDAADLASMTRPRGFPRKAWSNAIRGAEAYATAADYCIDGASNYNASALRSATSYIEIGTTYTDKATSILDSRY